MAGQLVLAFNRMIIFQNNSAMETTEGLLCLHCALCS